MIDTNRDGIYVGGPDSGEKQAARCRTPLIRAISGSPKLDYKFVHRFSGKEFDHSKKDLLATGGQDACLQVAGRAQCSRTLDRAANSRAANIRRKLCTGWGKYANFLSAPNCYLVTFVSGTRRSDFSGVSFRCDVDVGHRYIIRVRLHLICKTFLLVEPQRRARDVHVKTDLIAQSRMAGMMLIFPVIEHLIGRLIGFGLTWI